MVQAHWLIHNGVPFNVAYSLMESGPEGQAEALAWAVLHGQFEGGDFDWGSLQWRRRA